MINPITVLESVAMVFYIIAIYLCAQRFKNSSTDFQLVFILMMIGLLMGALASLTDVIQWVKRDLLARYHCLSREWKKLLRHYSGFYGSWQLTQ